MTNLKKKMISEMFNRIKKGPARADMEIYSKKNKNSICVFHWYNTKNTKHGYCVLYHDYENTKHDIIAKFTRWSDAFNFVADYILENDF